MCSDTCRACRARGLRAGPSTPAGRKIYSMRHVASQSERQNSVCLRACCLLIRAKLGHWGQP